MLRKAKTMHPGRILREEYMEPMRLDTAGLAASQADYGTDSQEDRGTHSGVM